uniref:FYVE-type domain-containing protein n=1 Tax=Schistocephalus solidus TaxID=70667 RepID=A0A0X3P6G2_SCHSO
MCAHTGSGNSTSSSAVESDDASPEYPRPSGPQGTPSKAERHRHSGSASDPGDFTASQLDPYGDGTPQSRRGTVGSAGSATPALDGHKASPSRLLPEAVEPCEKCKNLEDQLRALHNEHTSTSNRLNATLAELHSVKKSTEELETRLKAERTLFEEKTAGFEEKLEQLSSRMEALLKNYQGYRRATEAEFTRLTREREAAQMEMLEVEEHYQILLGKRRDAAAEMAAPIDLPSNKTDLELYTLQMREDMLSLNVARQELLRRLNDQTESHRVQLAEERRQRIQAETALRQHTVESREKIDQLIRANEAYTQSAAARAATERAAEHAAMESKLAKARVQELEGALANANEEIVNLRHKVSTLRTDLADSEKTQKDFVVLSQHLQVQLEKQRAQNEEVRWQDPEDVSHCASCETTFPAGNAGLRLKTNCKHCGKIFCPDCLSKQVPPQGQRSKPALVCDLCHTLLVNEAAPYFSRGSFSANKIKLPVSPSPASPSSTERLHNRLLDLVQPHRTAAPPEAAAPPAPPRPVRPPPYRPRGSAVSLPETAATAASPAAVSQTLRSSPVLTPTAAFTKREELSPSQ